MSFTLDGKEYATLSQLCREIGVTRNKYGAHKTVVDGIVFDSQLEAKRYGELKLMQLGGVISDLGLQPQFELSPKFRRNGKIVRAIKYIGDFRYLEGEQVVVEDVKGHKTAVFALKWKMAQAKWPSIDWRLT